MDAQRASQSPRESAVELVRTLRDAGHVAYFAGGCVRDALWGLEPTDYDVATDAPPGRVRELFRKTQAVGAAFGVILVRLGGNVIEVATFRTDGTYVDGRHPTEVHFSTAEEDAKRRDFTINGLFYDPIDDRVIDYVGGQQDLHDRVLRAIGEPAKRFEEDHLRLLRAVRFAARFALTIAPETAAAIERDAPLLAKISAERIADELERMLVPASRAAAGEMLFRFGLVDAVFGALGPSPTGGGPAGELRAGKSLLVELGNADVSFALALLTLMIDFRFQRGGMKHDVRGNLTPTDAAHLVSVARTCLKLSNEVLDAMSDICRWTHLVLNAREPGVALLKRFLARPHAREARRLLDALAATGAATQHIAALQARLDELAQTDFAPPPLLTGDDLVAAGYRPGKAFKGVLDDVYDAQLEGRVDTRDAALALARGMMGT